MNKRYLIVSKMLCFIKDSQINRLCAVICFFTLYLPFTYAAHVLSDGHLARRPLKSAGENTLSAARVARQTSTPRYDHPYCSRRSKIVLKQVNRNENVSVISIGGVDYSVGDHLSLPPLPIGVTYGVLSLEDSGGEVGAMGLVIDQNDYRGLPNNGTETQISLKSDVERTPVQIVDMQQVQRSGVCGSNTIALRNTFDHFVSFFNLYRTLLMERSGHLVDLTLIGYKGIYLDHRTGFNLSSLANIDESSTVIVFLDRNMGDINITSTVTTPSARSSYRIFFVGIDTSSTGMASNLMQTFPQPANPQPTTIVYSGDDAFINCRNTLSCGIQNINLRVNGSDSENRKFVHAPYDYNFYMYVTQVRGDVTERYAYESGDFTRDIVVHSNRVIGNVEDNICQVCGQADGMCNIKNFCIGGTTDCADTTVFDRRSFNCIRSAITTNSTTLPTTADTTEITNALTTDGATTATTEIDVTDLTTTDGVTTSTTEIDVADLTTTDGVTTAQAPTTNGVVSTEARTLATTSAITGVVWSTVTTGLSLSTKVATTLLPTTASAYLPGSSGGVSLTLIGAGVGGGLMLGVAVPVAVVCIGYCYYKKKYCFTREDREDREDPVKDLNWVENLIYKFGMETSV